MYKRHKRNKIRVADSIGANKRVLLPRDERVEKRETFFLWAHRARSDPIFDAGLTVAERDAETTASRRFTLLCSTKPPYAYTDEKSLMNSVPFSLFNPTGAR